MFIGSSLSVSFNKLPASIEEFTALPQLSDLTKPQNTAALLIAAFELYVHDPEAGVAAINMLKGPVKLSNHEIAFLKDRFCDKPYLPRAYFKGAAPQNNYKPLQPYTLEFEPDQRPQDLGEGYTRLYITTAGADSPRPIVLRKKASAPEWFVWEYPAIVMSIRVPAEQDPWA